MKLFLAILTFCFCVVLGAGGGCAIGSRLSREWWADYGMGLSGWQFKGGLCGLMVGLIVGALLARWIRRNGDE